METSDLVLSVLTFVAIFVALGIGVANVIQTKNIQKTERKQRLLNEIIDWAIDVTKVELLMEIADVTGIKDNRRARLYMYTTVDKLRFSFRQAITRGLYISGIVSILGVDLQLAVEKLIKGLEVHIALINEYMDTTMPSAVSLDETKSAAGKVEHNKQLLDESAEKVLEEAVKIKTKDIGKKGGKHV